MSGSGSDNNPTKCSPPTDGLVKGKRHPPPLAGLEGKTQQTLVLNN